MAVKLSGHDGSKPKSKVAPRPPLGYKRGMGNVGDRIKMRSNHWCRPGSTGAIVEIPQGWGQEVNEKRVLVKFDRKGVGLGGEFLFCDPEEFEVLALPPVRKARLRKLHGE